MTVADSEVEQALLDLDLKLLSEVKYETYRDSQGKWTHFKTGRRFVYVEMPKLNLQPFLQIGLWRASVYYREQIRPKRDNRVTEAPAGQQSDTANTEASTQANQKIDTPSSTGNTDSGHNNNMKEPSAGKPTYSDLASRSDNQLWLESKGAGVTTVVQPTKENRGRSQKKDKRGRLTNHWSPVANRSTSSKRKVREADTLVKSNNKIIKTATTPQSPVPQSESKSTEDRGLC